MVFKERLFSSSLCGTGLHLLHRKKRYLLYTSHLYICKLVKFNNILKAFHNKAELSERPALQSDTRKKHRSCSQSSDIPEVFFAIKTRINMSKTLLTPGGRKIMFVKKCLGISLESFRHAGGTGMENLLQLGAHHSEWTLDRERPGVGFKVLFFGSQRRFGSDLDQRTAFCTRTPSPIVCLAGLTPKQSLNTIFMAYPDTRLRCQSAQCTCTKALEFLTTYF